MNEASCASVLRIERLKHLHYAISGPGYTAQSTLRVSAPARSLIPAITRFNDFLLGITIHGRPRLGYSGTQIRAVHRAVEGRFDKMVDDQIPVTQILSVIIPVSLHHFGRRNHRCDCGRLLCQAAIDHM